MLMILSTGWIGAGFIYSFEIAVPLPRMFSKYPKLSHSARKPIDMVEGLVVME